VAQGVAIGLVVLLFILLAWSLLNDEGGDLAAAANRGERPTAPDFTLERLDRAGDLRLSSLRGKAVVLNVWASWCIPCKEEAPYL
jgi:cytochrome c biogenesis protein CcmG, thiol:disulfide interchange protein DsbE